MKKLLFLTAAGLTVVLFSCKKDTSAINNSNTVNSSTNMSGTTTSPGVKTVPYIWAINSFVVNGTDVSGQFANYRFDIQAPQLMTGNYTIVAVNGSTSYYGKWDRVSYSEVIISFSADGSDLSLLNGDWTLTNNQQYDIAMQTGTKSLSFHTNGETWPDK